MVADEQRGARHILFTSRFSMTLFKRAYGLQYAILERGSHFCASFAV